MTPKPELPKIRDEIRQCEEFIALCAQIKQLEQLDQSGASLVTREKLETQRASCLIELEEVQGVLKQEEELLNINSSTLHPLALEALKDRIKSGRIRGSTLKLNFEEATRQIGLMAGQAQENARLLEGLYATLEQHMEQGFHPNTVVEKLEALRELKRELDAEVKANYLQNAERRRTERRQDERRGAPNAVPIDESKFFAYLAEDLATAKKSVIIMSPFVCMERARVILPILARLVTEGCNVMVRTRPPDEHDEHLQREAMQVITESHRLLITIVQKSNLKDNVAIIDDHTGWEGQISILGPSEPGKTMRRIAGSTNVRELRHFLKES